MSEIKNRIIKTDLIRWRDLEWLQGGLKEISKDAFQKLKRSLIEHSFVDPFSVWESEDKIWILDGHFRKKAMEELEAEDHVIPDVLTANFIACRDMTDAQGLVLVYSAQYARITEETLYEYIMKNKIDFNQVKMNVDLPTIDMPKFESGWMKDESPRVDRPTMCLCPECGRQHQRRDESAGA